MKKVPLICLLALFCAAPALAQTTTRYHFDNFDTAAGVRVEAPPAPAPAATRPRRVRLTARTTDAATAGAPADRIAARLSPEALAPADATQPEARTAAGGSLDGFSTGSQLVDTLIVDSAARYGVDPLLIYSIMHQESTFKQRAISPKGARGLMQLMPATAARFGVTNIFDPRQNIDGGTRYVRWLLDRFRGDVRLALAGYNAGEGAVDKYGWRVPPYNETQNYVRRIFARYTLIRDPRAAVRAPKVTAQQVASMKEAEKPGVVVYSQSVFVVRLPDGKLRLVSQ
jgi:soluble lytic murein transglycosylase-like protein